MLKSIRNKTRILLLASYILAATGLVGCYREERKKEPQVRRQNVERVNYSGKQKVDAVTSNSTYSGSSVAVSVNGSSSDLETITSDKQSVTISTGNLDSIADISLTYDANKSVEKESVSLVKDAVGSQTSEGAGPSWYINSVNVTTNGTEITFEYNVVNSSTDDTDYRLTSLTIGAGTNESGQVNSAQGGAGGSSFYWNKVPGSNSVVFVYNPPLAQAISPGGNFGVFKITTTQTDKGQIYLNAKTINGDDFPPLPALGPKKIEIPKFIGISSGNSYDIGLSGLVPGREYFIRMKNDLKSPIWTPVTNFTATASEMTINLPDTTNRTRFFQAGYNH